MPDSSCPEWLRPYDFDLPAGQIAQRPTDRRDGAQLMCLDRRNGRRSVGSIANFPSLLREGDLVVRNASRVFPARLRGVRVDTGGAVEALLVRPTGADSEWVALLRPARRLRPGVELLFGGELPATIMAADEAGARTLRFDAGGVGLEAVIDRIGQVPLPPYITRDADEEDLGRYQTTYARVRGSVAAPTAGLHFTDGMFASMEAQGVSIVEVVLHVGPGTFRPVQVDVPEEHVMHHEWFSVGQECVEAIQSTRSQGGRVIAIGTTVVRVLETCAVGGGMIRAEPHGNTDLFIRPPHAFEVVDALLTNFHLPRSTLLMLVAAFAGTGPVMDAYRAAMAAGFRFYSYGDAMFIGDLESPASEGVIP